jgi:hypothetical protein
MTPREKILMVNDRPLKPIHVPEWDMTVYSRPWSGTIRAEVEKAHLKHKGQSVRVLCAVVALGILDEGGATIFTEADIDALMSKNFSVIDRIYDVLMARNEADPDSLKSAEKNSEATPIASSS